MGTFYSNCQVRCDSQEAVVEALTRLLKESAYIAPAVNNWVGVYPEGSRTDPAKLAKQLSAQLACGVFSFGVYDDDIFFYSLYENGRRRDRFNSSPDYFESVSRPEKARLRGKPEAVMSYCLPGVGASQIQDVLDPPFLAEGESNPLIETLQAITPGELPASLERMRRKKYWSASHQASDLARLLGIDEKLASLGYRYIERGETDTADKSFLFVSLDMLLPENRKKKLWELPMKAEAIEAIKAAISWGADVNSPTEYGEPFLVLAAFNCAAEVVQLLLDSGADVNSATTKRNKYGWEERGWTALIAAVQGGANVASGTEAMNTAPQLETVQLLINAGVKVNAKSESGWTALKEVQKKLEYFSALKSDRWYSDEALAECVARNTILLRMLRAAGATE